MRSLVAAVLLALSSVPAAAQGGRDCPQCPEMVRLPAGAFVMGAAPGEEEREGVPQEFRGRSQPQMRISIGYSVAMGKYEVTRGEFAAFAQATGHQAGSSCWGLGSDGRWGEQQGLSWRNPGFPQTERDPVVCVSWNDAQAYAEWLRRSTGKAYRLPTEAEWEYAARAGSQRARYWGDGRDGACRHANVADLTLADALRFEKKPEHFFLCPDGYVYTAPVGRFIPNAFGLYDMLGNAWEWVGDCWNENYVGAPGTPAYRDGDCSRRVARGGGWVNDPHNVRAAGRSGVVTGYRYYVLGFRVARTD